MGQQRFFMQKYREALAISAHNLIKAVRIRSSRYGAKKILTRKKNTVRPFPQSEQEEEREKCKRNESFYLLTLRF